MVTRKMKDLIERLYDLSMSQSLVWQETEADGVFQISFPTYSVSLSRRFPRDPEELEKDYWISIYNSDGKLIDEVSDVDLQADFKELGGRPPFHFMADLYDMARRSAMGAENVISDILAQLQ